VHPLVDLSGGFSRWATVARFAEDVWRDLLEDGRTKNLFLTSGRQLHWQFRDRGGEMVRGLHGGAAIAAGNEVRNLTQKVQTSADHQTVHRCLTFSNEESTAVRRL